MVSWHACERTLNTAKFTLEDNSASNSLHYPSSSCNDRASPPSEGVQLGLLSLSNSPNLAAALRPTSVPLHSSQSPSTHSSTMTAPNPPISHRKSNVAVIVNGTISGIALVILVSILVFLWRRRRHRKRVTVELSTAFEPKGQAKWMTPEPLPATMIRSGDVAQHPADQSTPSMEPMHVTVSTQRTNEPNGSESQSHLVEALDMISRMRPNANQREALMNSLNDLSNNATSSNALQDVAHMQQQQQQEPRAVEMQNNNVANMLSIFNLFSMLDPRERQALVSVLGNLVASDSSGELVMTGSAVSGPPPYSG